MANSKVASMTESRVYNCGLAGDDNRRASVPLFEPGWADGLRTPSMRSSVSQDALDGEVVLRDPEAILRGLLSCDMDVKAATQIILGYYNAAAGRVAIEASSGVSSTSVRQARTQRWHDEMGSWPSKRGHCYLLPVRWARRRRIGMALGECPSMQKFVSYITPDDIDVELSKKINVYRLPSVGNSTAVAYHMAESYDVGVKVGSFRAVVQSLLRSYPWLNSHDFGDDQILPGNLPIVGNLAVCDAFGQQFRESDGIMTGVVTDGGPMVIPGCDLVSCVGVRHDELADMERQDMQNISLPMQMALYSVTGVPPVVELDHMSHSFADQGRHLTVTLSLARSGERICMPVTTASVQLWVFPSGAVDTGMLPACCYIRQPGAVLPHYVTVIRDTVYMRVQVSVPDVFSSYIWQALRVSGFKLFLVSDGELLIPPGDTRPVRFLESELACMMRRFRELDIVSVLLDVSREVQSRDSARNDVNFRAVMSNASLFRSMWRRGTQN